MVRRRSLSPCSKSYPIAVEWTERLSCRVGLGRVEVLVLCHVSSGRSASLAFVNSLWTTPAWASTCRSWL
jgi:hypothetical protein